jgi:hypothetical protein
MHLRPYKKIFIIILSVWLVIVLLGVVFSRSMQQKVIQILSNQTEKYLLSEIHIRKNNIHFSVFKRFPHASIELRDVIVKMPKGFNKKESLLIKGDTLLFARKLYLQLNLKSVLSNNYEIEKIEIHKGYIQVLNDKKGNSSIDVLVKSDKKVKEQVSARINEFLCNEMMVFTSDISNNSKIRIYLNKGNMSGIFTRDQFSVNLKANGRIDQFVGKDQVLDLNQRFSVDTKIKNSKESFVIDKGYFRFGNIPFKVIGSVRTGENTLVDLIFSAKNISVKQIDKTLLSGLMGEKGLIPRSGSLSIQSTFIGYTRFSLPAIKASFRLENGKLYDKAHDLVLKDVFIVGNADNGQNHLPKSSTIRIDTFSFKTNNSHQWGKIKIQNLIDPSISLAIEGYLDVNDMQAVAPLKNITLKKGLLLNKAALSGQINKYSNSKSILENIKIEGNFALKDIEMSLDKYDLPPAKLNGKVELANKSILRFDELKAESVQSDVTITGTLSGFNTKNDIPTFIGSISSENIVVDNFLRAKDKRKGEIQPISFPDSLKISGQLKVDNFAFGKFHSKNFSSDIYYYNKKINSSNVKMEGFEGNLTGKITIHQRPSGNIGMYTNGYLENVNINLLFLGCNDFSQEVIKAEHIEGYLSGNIIFNSDWTNTLRFIPKTITAQGDISLVNGSLKNYDPLLGLSSFIHVDELKNVDFDNLHTIISIKEREVILDQTHIASSALTFDGSGLHDFDNNYQYRIQLGLSDVLWGKARKKNKNITEFGYEVEDGVGHTTLPLIIKGKGTHFDVKYDKKKARETFKIKVKEEKKELKELFKKKDKEIEEETSNFMIEKETKQEEVIKKPQLQKIDSQTYKSTSDDFILEWDDSEEE